MDKKFFIGPPDKETRRELFKDYFRKMTKISGDIDFEELAAMTENCVASEIKSITENVARAAMEEGNDITMEDILLVIKETPHSFSDEDLNKYKGYK
ncbi:hypothetical protein N9Y92_04270 [Chlamydiales bacterium]|nr:hypothetical protein [Chlamydiales bacterium]